MNRFRKTHIITILKNWEICNLPLDYFLSRYFRTHKSLGSHDRKEIAETIYRLIRWKNLTDHCIDPPFTWEKRLHLINSFPLDNTFVSSLPVHIQHAFPKFLYEIIVKDYGEKQAITLMNILNESAPLTIRANPLKITRDDLFKKWNQSFSIKPCTFSPHGIAFEQRASLFHLSEFKQGLFEVQDEGSQLVADKVEARPKMHILDYCAGSGGKTLAFAPKMHGKGQIYLHDIRKPILYQAKKRLKRAGIQNAQLLFPGKSWEKKYYQKMDIVLVDVPCSGTGTLRRTPEQKWKLSFDTITDLVKEQKEIFTKALQFVKPQGTIIYATCSILREENELQVEFFLNNLPVKLTCQPTKWLPKKGGMDGFFAASFQRNS